MTLTFTNGQDFLLRKQLNCRHRLAISMSLRHDVTETTVIWIPCE